MKLTKDQLDAMLVDYLYDELDPADRKRFEDALPEHPEVLETLRASARTRALFEKLELADPPQRVADAVMRQVRAAATPAPKVSWFDRLTSLLMQPAVATAMLFVVVLGTSLFLADKQGPQDRQEAMDELEQRAAERPPEPAAPALPEPARDLDDESARAPSPEPAPRAGAAGDGSPAAGVAAPQGAPVAATVQADEDHLEGLVVAPAPPPKAELTEKAKRANATARADASERATGAVSRPVAPQEGQVQRTAPEAGKDAAPGPSAAVANAPAGADDGRYYPLPSKQRTTRGVPTLASRPPEEQSADGPGGRRSQDTPAAPETEGGSAKPQAAPPAPVVAPRPDGETRDAKKVAELDKTETARKESAPPTPTEAKPADEDRSAPREDVKKLTAQFDEALKLDDLAKARLALAKLEKLPEAEKALKEMRARLAKAEQVATKRTKAAPPQKGDVEKAGAAKKAGSF